MVVQLPAPEPDAGVIEEARRRQRRHRMAGAVLLLASAILVLGLIGGSGAGGSGARRQARGGVPSAAAARPQESRPAPLRRVPPDIGESGLLAPGVGWGVNGLGFFVTRDGGRSWWRADIPGAFTGGDPIADLDAVATPSRSEIVVATGGNSLAGTCSDLAPGERASRPLGYAAVSSDTGHTWHTVPFWCSQPYAFSFTSAARGYALVGSHRGSLLYVSTDHARRWIRVASVPRGFTAIAFADARDGWAVRATVRNVRGALYRTTDGGRSWRRARICSARPVAAITITCETPVFFGAEDGVVPALMVDRRTGRYGLLVYTTADGGRHWLPHRVPTGQGMRGYVGRAVPFSAPSARDLFAFVRPYLYSSTDGGRTWSPSKHARLGDVSGIAFASATYGWLNSDLGTRRERFERTTDAGRHWRPVTAR